MKNKLRKIPLLVLLFVLGCSPQQAITPSITSKKEISLELKNLVTETCAIIKETDILFKRNQNYPNCSEGMSNNCNDQELNKWNNHYKCLFEQGKNNKTLDESEAACKDKGLNGINWGCNPTGQGI